MDIQKIISSDSFTKVVISVGLAFAALLVFEAGIYVGVRKAEFSSRIGENYYYRAIGGDTSRGPFGEALADTNGAAGKILSVNLPSFLVEDSSRGEKVVVISGTTAIKRLRDATSSSAIIPGEYAIVIGEPGDKGEVRATFIRLLPPPLSQ